MTAIEGTTGGRIGNDAREQFLALISFWFAALVFALAAFAAAQAKGPWIDEYWTAFLGDPAVPVSDLFRDRWLPDVSPIPASIIYYLSAVIAPDQRVSTLRLALNIPALVFLVVATSRYFSHSRTFRSFYPLSALLFLGTLWVARFSAEYRIYFWLWSCTLVGLQYLVWAAKEKRPRSIGLEDSIGGAALFLSLNLHFVGTILIAPSYALLLAFGIEQRGFRQLRFAIVAFGAGSAAWLFLSAVQYRYLQSWLDVHWIQTSTMDALRLFAATLAKIALTVGIVFALVALHVIRTRNRASSPKDRRANFIMVGLIVLGGLIGALAVLTLNAIQPVVVERYLVAWAPMAAVAASLLFVSYPMPFFAPLLLAASAVAVIGHEVRYQARNPQWREGLEAARSMRAACPAGRLIVSPLWRFLLDAGSRTARRETMVLRMGMNRYAAENRLPVEVVDSVSPVRISPRICPDFLWVPHGGNMLAVDDLQQLMRKGRFEVQPGARVSLAVHDDNAFLIRINGPRQ